MNSQDFSFHKIAYSRYGVSSHVLQTNNITHSVFTNRKFTCFLDYNMNYPKNGSCNSTVCVKKRIERVGIEATLWTCIREVLGLYLEQDTSYTD
jgi:hypothetical protein